MEDEINPEVLRTINDIRTSTPKRGITEVISLMGVKDANLHKFEYAWPIVGGGWLLTVWAEFIHVHPSGHWFSVESLDTKRRLGGGERSKDQQSRAENRVKAMKALNLNGQSGLAVLQINQVSIKEMERHKNAKVSVRVKDREHWHVSRWDSVRNLVVLVRGETSWTLTNAELDQYAQWLRDLGELGPTVETHYPAASSDSKGAAAPDAEAQPVDEQPQDDSSPPDDESSSTPEIVFPDQAHRDAVEDASIEFVTALYESKNLEVEDVSTECLGYDLEVRERQGAVKYRIEVKGTSSVKEGFFLTRNEWNCAQREPLWRLAIVTQALTAPTAAVYGAKDVARAFSFEPLVWRCALAQPPGATSSQGATWVERAAK